VNDETAAQTGTSEPGASDDGGRGLWEPMAPLEGVHCIQGDIKSLKTAESITQHCQG